MQRKQIQIFLLIYSRNKNNQLNNYYSLQIKIATQNTFYTHAEEASLLSGVPRRHPWLLKVPRAPLRVNPRGP